jgi:hypothetical protein
MMSGLPGTFGTSMQKKYFVTASYVFSSAVSRDRSTLLKAKDIMSGLTETDLTCTKVNK